MSADKTPIAERYQGEYRKWKGSAFLVYESPLICGLIEELSAAEQRERVLRDALEYYAAEMEHNKFYIVTAHDRAFISDLSDWGGKARAALASAQGKEQP